MQGVLAGRYRLERQLGKGGMGSVWLAEHLSLRSWVAVKLMDPAIAATPEGAERFRREAQAAASLRSAHVVQVLDYGVHETTPYLVMELMQGESLAACLEREKRLTPARTVSIMTQVARALGRAHSAGIVHRDLKPDNVFLVKEDDQELVKILDFGIAKTPQSSFGGMETKTGVTMGTPYYMSPEQVEGKKAVDFRTDLWAMAVIAVECMTGVRPFDGSTFGELLLNICARPIAPPSSQGFVLPGFDEWFAKATNRDPEQRFASAQELASTLKAIVEGSGARGLVAAPAPVPSGNPGSAPGGYAAAATGGPAMSTPAGVTGQPHTSPSVSSINTAQALQAALPRPSPLPWILLVAVLLVSAVGATVLLMRDKAASPAPESTASVAALPTTPSAEPKLAPAPQASAASDAPATSGSAKHAATPSREPQHEAMPSEPLAPPSRPPAGAHTTVASPPPTGPAAGPASGKAARCFSDPFSGQIRLAGGSAGAGAATFACKQDPFTGKYKKL